ncbi:MAG: signal peptide peptidase SppA [Nevskiales bacterium]
MADTTSRRGFWSRLWQFFVVVTRLFIVVFLLAPLALFAYAYFAAPQFKIEDGVALVWAPDGVVLERSEFDPQEILAQQLFGQESPYSLLRDLVDSLDYAAQDTRIKALFLKLDGLEYAGMAQLEEMSSAITRFRASGKPVYAYAGDYTQDQYYLAAQADQLFLDPLGGVWIEGFGMYQHYFKDALEKLQIDLHVFRVGEYKSAVEPFIRNDMSPEARAANQAWLDVLWQVYKRGVAGARELEPAAVESYVAEFPVRLVEVLGDAGALAKNAKLVDDLLTREQVRQKLRELVGTDTEHGSFRQLDDQTYLAAVRVEKSRGKAPPSHIGLAVAQGALVDGESGRGTTGGDTLAYLIEDARRDEKLAALVLRIDSPGGSVSASEAVRREIELMRAAGKPVIVSMSSTAASGGYWIAMNADEIWADDTTITGSIGVFGLLPTFDKTLGKLGIHVDGLGTTPLAGATRLDRPLAPDIAAAMQAGVEYYYRQFVGQVAAARRLDVAQADQLAQGRVWSGLDAKRLGLVDNIGGLHEATAAAAKLAGLAEGQYRLSPLDAAPDWRTAIFDLLSSRIEIWLQVLGAAELTQPFHVIREQLGVGWLNDRRGVYAHCGCEGMRSSWR